MVKNATSHKRAQSWSGVPRILKPGADVQLHDPTIRLRDPKIIQGALLESVEAGDYEDIVTIYRAHLRVMNRTHAAKELGVSRQYIHKMIKTKNRPSLKTFAAFMKALAKRAA